MSEKITALFVPVPPTFYIKKAPYFYGAF